MANICNFSMMIAGKTKESVDNFVNALQQKGKYFMGRGVVIELEDESERDYNGNFRKQVDGWCKWSIETALTDNAISMRENPDMWAWGDIDVSQVEFVTLSEACELFNVSVDVFSEELGMQFEEHIRIDMDYPDRNLNECRDLGGFKWDFDI